LASSGAQITVYRDRVRRFLAEHRSSAGAAAGYVLVHELAHVMQGVARHSESGILKAHWSGDDYKDMMFHKLAFTDSDVELIRRGLALQLASRRSGLVAKAENSVPVISDLATRLYTAPSLSPGDIQAGTLKPIIEIPGEFSK
jgi:hypothetical protein